MAVKFLRIFGHLIVKLFIDFSIISFPRHYEWLVQYLCEYGSNSINELWLQRIPNSVSFPAHFDLARPFMNVRILEMSECVIKNEFQFGVMFPNLHTLRLDENAYRNTSVIRTHFPSVKHLSFDGRILYSLKRFESDDIAELLRLNPQLEKLELKLHARFSDESNIIQIIADNLPNLKLLKLKMGYPSLRLTTVHLEHVEHFSCGSIYSINPFSFSKLKHLELNNCHCSDDSVRSLIGSSEYLTSILVKYNLDNLDNFNRNVRFLFEIENVLANIEKMEILCVEDVPWEHVLQFLKKNRALKQFSMIGKYNDASYEFVHEIISGSSQFKIRKGRIEFMIERESDHSSTKYILKHLKWRNSSIDKYAEYIQLCSYGELESTTRENECYTEGALKLRGLRSMKYYP